MNGVTAHVLVAFDEDDVDIDSLVDAVEAVEEAHGTHEDTFSWSHPPHPTDDTAVASAAVALAADVLGIVSATTGRLARLGVPPRGLRAPVAIVEAQPRLRMALAARLGPVGADLVLAVANAAVHGLTEGAGPLAVDAVNRLLQLGELRSRRDVWELNELALHSTGHALPAETHERKPRPVPLPEGPVETVADRISAASVLGAGGILAWTRDPGQAADALLATVPRAARMELARMGVVPMDNTVLRRLDRVTAVVVDLRDPLTPVLALGAAASAVVGSSVDAALVASVMIGNALISGAERMRAERALCRLLIAEQVVARRVRWDPPLAAAAAATARPRATARRQATARPRATQPNATGARGALVAGLFTGIDEAPVVTVPAHALTAGDIIMLRPSDVVPADARLLLADALEIDESSLTGESIPVTKAAAATPGAPLAERACMIYEGSSVLAGTGYAVVTATGHATEAGRAARTASRLVPPTGIQAHLAELTRIALPATGLGGTGRRGTWTCPGRTAATGGCFRGRGGSGRGA